MTVYVDVIRNYQEQEFSNKAAQRYGKQWCHMWADDLEELHAVAEKIGLKRSYFQYKNSGIPHYDLTPAKRTKALAIGAVEADVHKRIEMRQQGIFKAQFEQLGII